MPQSPHVQEKVDFTKRRIVTFCLAWNKLDKLQLGASFL